MLCVLLNMHINYDLTLKKYWLQLLGENKVYLNIYIYTFFSQTTQNLNSTQKLKNENHPKKLFSSKFWPNREWCLNLCLNFVILSSKFVILSTLQKNYIITLLHCKKMLIKLLVKLFHARINLCIFFWQKQPTSYFAKISVLFFLEQFF